jgi:hypothetical protein
MFVRGLKALSYQEWPGQHLVTPGSQKKRSAWPIVVAVVAVVAIGAGAGAWFMWGGSGDDAGADLPENQNLTAMSFPDPDSFDYAKGPAAMCAALDEVMSARGYLHVSGKKADGGQYCRFITPGLSLLKDGSNELRVDIGVWRDNAETRYAGLESSAIEKSQSQQKNPSYSVSKVERFPVGDAGFIFHREGDRADTEAYFRSGDDLMSVSVWGTTLVSTSGGSPETKSLTEEITYREITDIMASLTGDGEPGPPQITAPELAQSPVLSGLANLSFPEGLTTASACEKVAPVAKTMGMQKSSSACGFKVGSDNWRDHGVGYKEWEMSISARDYPPEGNIEAVEELARDLRSNLKISADRPCDPLYELPFADTGYATYCGNKLYVGFVLDDRLYVKVEMHGYHVVAGHNLKPLPEDEVLGNLAATLTAMSG